MRKAYIAAKAIRLCHVRPEVTIRRGDQITYDSRRVLAQYRGGNLLTTVVVSPLGIKALLAAGVIVTG